MQPTPSDAMSDTHTYNPNTWLITRPEPESQALCQRLEQWGLNTVSLPLLKRDPLPDTELAQANIDVTSYDGVICISPTAAKIGVGYLASHHPKTLHHTQWFAVGSHTQTALTAFNLNAAAPIEETSEGLLALPPLQNSTNQRWLIIRGSEGRELLKNQLTQQHNHVDYWSVYQRASVEYAPSIILEALQRIGIDPDLTLNSSGRGGIIITSETSLQNLMNHWQALAQPHSSASTAITELPILVISQRLQKQAHLLGFKRIALSNSLKDEDLLNSFRKLSS